MKTDYIHEILIVDRSGSMQSVLEETRGGLRQHFEMQRNLPGKNTITVVTFDNLRDVPRLRADLNTVEPLSDAEFQPRGSTALYDAMAYAIDSEGAWLATLPEHERPHKVLVMVVTDGMENASQETTGQALRSRIERQQKDYGWNFSYMAANQDAILQAGALGVPAANAINFSSTKRGTAAAMAVMNSTAQNYRVTRGISGQSLYSAAHVDDLDQDS